MPIKNVDYATKGPVDRTVIYHFFKTKTTLSLHRS